MKKFIVLLLTAALVVCSAFNVIASDPIRIVVNGKEVVSEVAPQIIEGRTMVPIRAIAEALDLNVSWDSAANTVFITSKTPHTQTQQQPSTPPQTQPQTEPQPTADPSLITKAEYDKITIGMTYEQVKAIVGSPGEPLIITDEFEYVKDLHMEVYTFKGASGHASILFQDGKVLKKDMFGLT